MKTELVKADTLIPYARNPRKNSAAVDKIAASIKEFGWQQPIVVDKENVIIAGHTRLLAAQKLGIEDVPVHVADLSETQAKAYRLADNRLSEDADWDIEMLGLEIRELDDLGFELDLTGFNNTELANLLIEPNFEVGTEDEQGKLDQLDPKYVICPKCGDEFDIREQT
jgi:ParB-like chromosome segregation protein Spo0J